MGVDVRRLEGLGRIARQWGKAHLNPSSGILFDLGASPRRVLNLAFNDASETLETAHKLCQ